MFNESLCFNFRRWNFLSLMKKVFLFGCVLVFSGCSVANNTFKSNAEKHKKKTKTQIHEKYDFNLKPIIGTRNKDTQTIVDMGVVLKIWVAPYKSRSGILTAMHDIYIWGKRPDFVVGEKLPDGKKVNNISSNAEKYFFPINSTDYKFKDKAPKKNLPETEADRKIKNFLKNQQKLFKKEKATKAQK